VELQAGSREALYQIMVARYYSSSLARFMAVDPGDDTDLEDPQSWNKYAYVRNNPINNTDPTGQFFETAFDVAMAVVSVKQAISNPSLGNIAGAVLDVAAVVVPGAPAVGGRLIDAAQAGGKVLDAANAADNVVDTGKAAGAAADYSKIPDPATGAKAGGDFTPRQKAGAMDANRQANDGVLKSDKSGAELSPSKQSQKGQKRDPNEANVDHKTPKAKGGTNASSNIQVLSLKENVKKGAN